VVVCRSTLRGVIALRLVAIGGGNYGGRNYGVVGMSVERRIKGTRVRDERLYGRWQPVEFTSLR